VLHQPVEGRRAVVDGVGEQAFGLLAVGDRQDGEPAGRAEPVYDATVGVDAAELEGAAVHVQDGAGPAVALVEVLRFDVLPVPGVCLDPAARGARQAGDRGEHEVGDDQAVLERAAQRPQRQRRSHGDPGQGADLAGAQAGALRAVLDHLGASLPMTEMLIRKRGRVKTRSRFRTGFPEMDR